MFIFWGRTHLGAIDEVDGAYVATLFQLVQGLPIVPLGTHVVFPPRPGERPRTLRIRTSKRSMWLGYVRVYGGLLVLGGVFLACIAILSAPQGSHQPCVVTLMALAIAAAWVGSMRGTQAERRGLLRAYSVATGIPADPAILSVEQVDVAQHLRKVLPERCREIAPDSYRSAPGGAPWLEVALDPATTNLRVLCEALALARIDAVLGDEHERVRMTELHDALWAKLRRLDPSIITTKDAVRQLRPIAGAAVAVGALLMVGFANIAPLALEARRASRFTSTSTSTSRPGPGRPQSPIRGRPTTHDDILATGTRVEVELDDGWHAGLVEEGGDVTIRVRLENGRIVDAVRGPKLLVRPRSAGP